LCVAFIAISNKGGSGGRQHNAVCSMLRNRVVRVGDEVGGGGGPT